MTLRTPETAPNVAALASAVADPTRAMVCVTLLDGRAWTATELGTHLGVPKSSMSEHLSILVAHGILAERRQGRHRYVQLASREVADWFEHTASLAPTHLTPVPSLAVKRRDAQLAAARTCYRHLAGDLGVRLAATLAARGWVSEDAAVTQDGRAALRDAWGIEVPAHAGGSRPLSKWCLDWTERRSHLGGWLGDELCTTFLARGWITRKPESRAIELTTTGRIELASVLAADVVTHA